MFYDSIASLPLKVYDKIVSGEGDLRLLDSEGKIENETRLRDAWENINKEFFKEFGVEDRQLVILKHKSKYIQLMGDFYLNGDRMARTMANIERDAWNAIAGKGENESYLKVCVELSKALKLRIDYNTISVGEFFHYIKS